VAALAMVVGCACAACAATLSISTDKLTYSGTALLVDAGLAALAIARRRD